jgi:Cu-Zn family superoxide dismutase
MKAIAYFDPKINNGIHGTIRLEQLHSQAPVYFFFSLGGFKAYSVHAIHIHEYGDLTEGCKSLGAHFNPSQRKHSHSEKGHAGDLFNNFQTDAKGQFISAFQTTKLSLFPNARCILGRSIVIHKFPDDLGLGGLFEEKSQQFVLYRDMSDDQLFQIVQNLGYFSSPTDRRKMLQKLESESVSTGNASTRIACAIIGVAQ